MTEQFIQERRYLLGVSPRTAIWYKCSFKAFEDAIGSKEAVRQRIVELRQRNVSPITINSYLRCINNAYFMWLHREHGRELVRIPKLMEEQKILSTFSAEQIKAILSFRPKGRNLTRADMVACLLLDTGLRISEALGLRTPDIDFDNLVLKVYGKGSKERLVPMSLDRNFQRDFKQLGKRLNITGVRMSPHACRHSFACEYLRRGGNLEFLRRILGHSSILTTQKYLRSLGVQDLQAAHEGLSPLTPEHLRGSRAEIAAR